MDCPVIIPEAGNAKNATRLAISSGSSALWIACWGKICCNIEIDKVEFDVGDEDYEDKTDENDNSSETKPKLIPSSKSIMV